MTKAVYILAILALAPITSRSAQPIHDGYAIIGPAKTLASELDQPVHRRIHGATLGEGFQELLAGTGYRLAHAEATDPALPRLFGQPYPEQQRQLGPQSLQEILQRLAGPAWQLVTDPLNRIVSFEVNPAYQATAATQSTPVLSAGRGGLCQTPERDLTVPWARRQYWCLPGLKDAIRHPTQRRLAASHQGMQKCHMRY